MSQARKWAARTRELTSFKVVDFLEAAMKMAAAGRDIVRLETGEPRFETPAPIVEAAERALREGRTCYTPALGIPELRQAIADFCLRRYGVRVAAARVVVTTGSSAALGMICDLLIDPGAGVLLTDPGYPCNANFVRRAGGVPQFLPVTAAAHYQPTAAEVERAWGDTTVALMVASPGNPTGATLSRPELGALVAAVAARGGSLVVDEIYHGLVYAAKTVSVLEFSDQAFAINGFSKYFGMTGWRLGWMVVPECAIDAINVMAQNFYISPPSIAQYAALAAFDPAVLEVFEARREALRVRRDFLVPALRELGFSVPQTPAGAFYVYAGIDGLADDSEAFCWQMLERAGVAFTPGTDFGSFHARRHVRFAYTAPLPQLELAVERLRRALGR